MFSELLWIIGFYVAAAALAHGVYARSAGAGKRHYVLVAENHQMQIEWYVRALRRFSRRTGTDIGITVILENSTDETRAILEKIARGNDNIGFIGGEPDAYTRMREQMLQQAETPGMDPADLKQFVWVDLNNREDLSRLPL